jgi:hypothetical protein
MVGSAGNAPVRHFRLCFVTPDLQSGSRITSVKNGSGSGSHTHLKKFMRLLSVHGSGFPQLKLVESLGDAPASRPGNFFSVNSCSFTLRAGFGIPC